MNFGAWVVISLAVLGFLIAVFSIGRDRKAITPPTSQEAPANFVVLLVFAGLWWWALLSALEWPLNLFGCIAVAWGSFTWVRVAYRTGAGRPARPALEGVKAVTTGLFYAVYSAAWVLVLLLAFGVLDWPEVTS